MGDLEEKFFKKNIPGKYSTWGDEYNEKSRDGDGDDDDDDYDPHLDDDKNGGCCDGGNGWGRGGDRGRGSSMTEEINVQGTMGGVGVGVGNRRHNTGVKGVLSDHRQAKAFERLQIANEEMERQKAFRNATEAPRMKPGEESMSIAATRTAAAERQRRRNRSRDRNMEAQSDSDSDSDSDSFLDNDDDMDDFLQAYRQQRMAQMKAQASTSQRPRPPRTIYRNVTELENLIQFSNVIDEMNALDDEDEDKGTGTKAGKGNVNVNGTGTYCIFHLYHPTHAKCILMNEHLEHLANHQMMPHCRFFRLRATLVKENFDPVGYPCILVYRDGREVANLTPITRYLDGGASEFASASSSSSYSSMGRFTVEDIQCALRLNGVIEDA